MAENKPGIDTFHRVREQCEQANADAWRAFLALYGPLGLHLVGMYAPDLAAADPPLGKTVWEGTLRRLAENNFERFRGTARQSEREFLADVRALLLETLAEQDAKGGASEANAATPDRAGASTPEGCASQAKLEPQKLAALLEGLPLLHQEMLFLKLAGYSDGTIEKMLRVAPRVAEKSFARLSPDFAAALSAQKDRCLWPSEWLAILRSARAAKKETCPELHQILRVHDGQVSWYDKEPVERQVSGCLYCLERWTALREVGYWRRMAPTVSSEQIEEWLRVLPVRVEEKKKSLLRRMLG
jgi:hypothetical protein